ncbi:aromatic ring hydroxylase [Candidatus Bathyarchaeota archaeon ex4484_135]|nr:MAG: aromatic ring hydroxylase [Candidatus Bathyarchaeota archaeon ex4484_135]
MVLLSPEEYLETVKKPKRMIYINGELVEDLLEHPVTSSVLKVMMRSYEMEKDPAYKGVLTAKSFVTGREVSRSISVHRSTDDLCKRVEMGLTYAREFGTCYYACPGCDILTALAATTWEMDKELGTDYHSRLKAFIKELEDGDLRCSGAVTDPRGDRSLRPLDQPDAFVRVVEKRSDGIVIRGCKVHQSGAWANHYHLVIPNVALREGEEQFALACAVPAGGKGVKYVGQFNLYTAMRLKADPGDVPNLPYGFRETCVIIFDDVFVPWDRVFLCGEVNYVAGLVTRFANIHRMICGGSCKTGFMDIIIGLMALTAEGLGTSRARHIRNYLTKAVIMRNIIYACARMAAENGREDPEGSGFYIPDVIYANMAKLLSAEYFYEIMKYACDICGGMVVTAPSIRDLQVPDVGEKLKNYLKARMTAEERLKMARLFQLWLLHCPATWHGAGPPEYEMVFLRRAIDLEPFKQLAKKFI